MKKCPGCGHMLAEYFKFCCDCGFKLPVQSQVCTSDKNTAEHQTSAVSEAEPQHENEPLTLSGNKADTPLKHSSEEPGGNVKKKSGDTPSNTELTTDTHQKEESSGSESYAVVDVPPTGTPSKNTATPTIPSKPPTSLIPSPYHTTTEDQPEGHRRHVQDQSVGETTETRTAKRKQSLENQDERLPSQHKESEKQSNNGGGDASKSSTAGSPPAKKDRPPNQSNDEDIQQVTSKKKKDQREKPTQMSPEGSKEAGVRNEQQTSSNQSDKCTKDEANSQPCV
ncbi:hypothetical protein J4Q44_G00078810 [Coregonus suidteri]|uniref:Uncharacterized protein n=1 Tax=Coregonus suidteri TaxID=861788 RepID=A0AAN8MBJ4_9TELE